MKLKFGMKDKPTIPAFTILLTWRWPFVRFSADGLLQVRRHEGESDEVYADRMDLARQWNAIAVALRMPSVRFVLGVLVAVLVFGCVALAMMVAQ